MEKLSVLPRSYRANQEALAQPLLSPISQKSETFETLSWVSLPHITPSNAKFVFNFCFCPQSQSTHLYPEAKTLNPSKELEAVHFRLQSSSCMREHSPCILTEPPQLPRGNQKRFPSNHNPAPGAGKIVKGNPNTCTSWGLRRIMLHNRLFCCWHLWNIYHFSVHFNFDVWSTVFPLGLVILLSKHIFVKLYQSCRIFHLIFTRLLLTHLCRLVSLRKYEFCSYMLS